MVDVIMSCNSIVEAEIMTLKQLQYVVTVAETGNMTEAAGKLFIAQPSLTSAIHELEKEFGIGDGDFT